MAARELQREGHRVTVIEQGSQVGGIWMYSDDIETDDLLGTKDAPTHATALCTVHLCLERQRCRARCGLQV